MQNIRYKDIDIIILFVALLLSIFIPYFTLIICFLLFSYLNDRLKNSILVFLIILFLSSLNYSRIIEGDLLLYNEWYKNAYGQTVSSYLKSIPLDHIFHLSLVLHSKTINNFNNYIFITTFLIYIIYYISLDRILTEFKITNSIILSIFIIFAFTSEIFSLSSHIIRQFLAASIFLLAFSSRSKTTKIVIYIIACLTHFSVLVFLPIFFLKKSKIRYNQERTLLYSFSIIIFFLSSYLFIFLGSINTGNITLSNILGRFSQQKNADNGSVGIVGYSLLLISILVTYIKVYSKNEKNLITLLIYLNAVLIVLIPYKLLFLRFFIFIYFILPIVLPIYLKNINLKSRGILFILSIIMLIRFSDLHNNLLWNYSISSNLLLINFIHKTWESFI